MCTGKGFGRGDREIAICQSYLGGLVTGCGWEGEGGSRRWRAASFPEGRGASGEGWGGTELRGTTQGQREKRE